MIYAFTRSALDLISTELEEAAAVHGAGTLRTTLKVTLPLASSPFFEHPLRLEVGLPSRCP